MTIEHDQQKIDIGKSFINLHKDGLAMLMLARTNCIGDERYLTVYDNLRTGKHGYLEGNNTVHGKNTRFKVVIGQCESKSGSREVFAFDVIQSNNSSTH